MKYEKVSVDVITFGKDIIFLTSSPDCPSNYSTAEAALQNECGGFSGDVHSFTCSSFGGYGSHAPKGATVTIAGTTYIYVFETHGNSGRWYCSVNN